MAYDQLGTLVFSPSSRIASGNAASRGVARQREQAQAAPRPSRIRMNVRVAGNGETRLKVKFDALMTDEPTFSFGCVAAKPLRFGELPLATAIVLSWNKTHAGMYQGAEVGFRVESNKFDIITNFSLTFEASALRSTNIGNSQIGEF